MTDRTEKPNPIIADCDVAVAASNGELAHRLRMSVFESGTVIVALESACGTHYSQMHITEEGLEKFLLEAAATLQTARSERAVRGAEAQTEARIDAVKNGGRRAHVFTGDDDTCDVCGEVIRNDLGCIGVAAAERRRDAKQDARDEDETIRSLGALR